MQLIVDTDTDIRVQTKMSTMQQESLSEKFINTSLIQNVCSDNITDITNRNDECAKNQEIVVKACDGNVAAADQVAQSAKNQIPILNEKSSNKCEELRICDKESTENNENGTQIENKKDAQEKVNSKITMIKSDKLVEEKMETEVNIVEYKSNSEINNEIMQENKQNCELDKDELNNRLLEDKIESDEQVKDNTEKDNVQTQDDVNISMKEYKIDNQVNSDIKDTVEEQVNATNEIEDKTVKQNQENIEMDIIIDERDKMNNIESVDKIEGQVEVTNVVAEAKSGNQNEVEVTNEKKCNEEKENHQNIEMDIKNEEQDKLNVNIMADKIVEQLEVTHKMGDKPNQRKVEVNDETNDKIENKGNIEVDVTIKEQDNININVAADKVEELTEVTVEIENHIEKQNEGNIEMDVTIEEQDNIYVNVTADKIKELVQETHELEDKIGNKNVENMEMDVIIEGQDKVDSSVTADTIVEEIDMAHEIKDKSEIQSEDNIEMDIAIDELNKVTSSVRGDKIKDVKVVNAIEDKVISKKEGKIVQGNQDNIEMDVTFEEQDKVNTSVSNNKIEKGNEENSETDVSFEEQDEVNNSVIEDKLKEEIKVDYVMDNTIIDEQVKVTRDIENEIKRGNRENSEKYVTVLEPDNVNISTIESKSEELHTEKGTVHEKVKDKLEEPDHLNFSAKENKTEGRSHDNNDIKEMFDKFCEEKSEIQDKFEEQQNEISDIIDQLEQKEKEESQIKDNIIEQAQINRDIEDRQNVQISIPIDIVATLDKRSVDNCEINQLKNNTHLKRIQARPFNSEKEIDKDRLEDITNITSHESAQKSNQFEKKCQEVDKHNNDSKRISENVQNTNKVDDKKMIEITEQKLETEDSNEERISNTFKSNTESAVTQMDTDEVIDIADEKDEDDEKEPVNTEKVNTSERKAEIALKNDIQKNVSIAPDEVAIGSYDKSDPEVSIQEENVELTSLKKSITETHEEKKKLTHISKLSNTLDILSDEEEDLPIETPQKEMPASGDKECTSINIDDDDDIMLIDEESSSKDDKNKTESKPEPENEVHLKEENEVQLRDKEQLTETSENQKDTVEAEVAAPSVTETKTSEPKLDLIKAQEETPVSKKPLVKINFLKTCKKNLADMTRDELEEFCILKIVEGVVDRSNLSEIKSQFKAMTLNIEEYKKKASALTKQNRDLQVVLKSVQEEQKKKSNMPITPLKITRSVGMQVLMTDKVGLRKKSQNPNTAKNNAAANSGANRQVKPAQNNIRLQKMLTNTTPNLPIPVPRLVPAINNSSMNNMKIQPPSANTPVKSQVTGPVNKSPVPNVSNGLPATPLIPKPEKRPHSRMQQNDSVTVDLTDDEPPAKVISRNVAPPVRLVPPQNLLAPNRQPFGQNVSNPRKVYIPISGSQSPVGVRPGQTIMLRTISPQGPRQRVPTPGVAKPNQSPNAVRMQRVPSRHPAPLPESVKQYQPQNWKALPPAPELKLSKVENGIVISWKIDGYQEETYEEIASYQLYAYQETTSPPSTALWKKIGDVKALALPMACTLTQFMAGYKYYFAVRAVDIRSRLGPFSLPGSILLLNKM